MGNLSPLVILFIAISIINLINKQAQKGAKQKSRAPGQAQTGRTGQMPPRQRQSQDPPAHKVQPAYSEAGGDFDDTQYEGMEFENRDRTGSLPYAEPDIDRAERTKRHEDGDAIPAEEDTREIDGLLTFSPEDIFRSIVMSEILGTPRAIKRNIR